MSPTMRRNHGSNFLYDGYYRNDKLRARLQESEFKTPYALAKHLGLNIDTTYRVFNGTASYKQVWPVAEFFEMDWSELHDLTFQQSQSHRSVLNSRAVR